ncbi:hypothetical protein ABB37_03963 [Leptomonas pyrrhocoris]|uniref:Uncharacterized protein n=1 Tax=Leptomonas pyrrhocoris TaxID=157538 RepID=A0A0N0DWC7_LEPPY|nr:hypothetical protein ABB37_03963 [Leptomonas pyrrhocoris]KPA81638.1 hypothetical protein ABB37_03963 [Leptomonas pyrrhocoris]|eukprot:XP_015660077.1 hypothetical protein ABB37_03963 [Leptomonas pyrrhocoris]
MQGGGSFWAWHRIAVLKSIVLLASLIGAVLPVTAWSGVDAYTIVVLKSFDTDVVLQEQFYNAPNATPFLISRDGYRILDSPVDFSRSRSGKGVVAESSGADSVSPAYLLEPTLTTGVAYRGVKADNAPLPYQGRLSGEWVVWSKEAPAHRTPGAAATAPLLLHCRLPLPQNRTEVERRQRRYIAQHKTALSMALERWWHTAPAEHASRCLYGDGEKALTGVERYYELCPRGVVSRVQHRQLLSLLRGGETDVEAAAAAPKKRTKAASSSVLDFLHEMHQSLSARHAILRSPRYDGVFEEIGRFHPRYSKPQWNSEYLVWESWYPSTRSCATHYTTISSFEKPSAVDVNASPARRKIHPQDAYWKTVVRFRCPSHPHARENKKLTTWIVTEVRQLCEYHVELMSELVCGWEQELDSFNVNPVPCVVLD